MASQIVELYAALAASSVTVNGKAVAVKGPESLPSKLDTAVLPVRLLTPISQFLPQNVSSAVWAAPGSSVVTQLTWSLADLMYWKPLAQGEGIRAVADDLVVYMREYTTMLQGLVMPAVGSTMWIANVGMQASVLEYPIYSEQFYYGVAATLTVTEKIL